MDYNTCVHAFSYTHHQNVCKHSDCDEEKVINENENEVLNKLLMANIHVSYILVLTILWFLFLQGSMGNTKVFTD